jgi:hypothetical protein
MATKKSSQINFRVTDTQARKIKFVARENKKTIQALLEESIDLRCKIPKTFWTEIEKIAETYQLPAATVFAHMVVKQASIDYAYLQVFGKRPPGINREFRFDEKGLVTGDQLSNLLLDEYTELFKTLKEKFIRVDKLEKAGKKIPKDMDHLLSSTEAYLSTSVI